MLICCKVCVANKLRRVLECSGCGKKLLSESGMRYHIQRKHPVC